MNGAVEIYTPRVVRWADDITTAWRSGVEAILNTAQLLVEAQKDLEERGEWSQLIGANDYPGMLPFKKSFALMLQKIGRSKRLYQHAGILPSDSTTLYHLARLNEDRFCVLIENGAINPSMKRNEASAETRKEKKEQDEARILSIVPAVGKHRALVIDPPWDYEWLSLAGRASPGYATMSHNELLAMDVAKWAEDNCHLYLWTTNNFITRASELMAAWGFQHKTVLTWVKPRIGLGSYFRNSTEHVLFGVCGELRTRADDIPTHFHAPVGEHSEKPEEFYSIVRRASYPPYGEVFQRQRRPDFCNLFEEKEAVA